MTWLALGASLWLQLPVATIGSPAAGRCSGLNLQLKAEPPVEPG